MDAILSRPLPLLFLMPFLAFAGRVAANDLVVTLPEGMRAKSAAATASAVKVESPGAIAGRTVTFSKVLPDTPYDVRITLAGGDVIQGVNLNWYDEEEAKPDAGPLDDDDREQIRAIVQDVPGFYNKPDVLRLSGDHDRATGLLRLVRDKDFYNGAGQVIWRIELWYFKNQSGGWEAVQQQNRVIRRERFKTAAEYKAATEHASFAPELGGLIVPKDTDKRTVAFAGNVIAATAPATKPTKAAAE